MLTQQPFSGCGSRTDRIVIHEAAYADSDGDAMEHHVKPHAQALQRQTQCQRAKYHAVSKKLEHHKQWPGAFGNSLEMASELKGVKADLELIMEQLRSMAQQTADS